MLHYYVVKNGRNVSDFDDFDKAYDMAEAIGADLSVEYIDKDETQTDTKE